MSTRRAFLSALFAVPVAALLPDIRRPSVWERGKAKVAKVAEWATMICVWGESDGPITVTAPKDPTIFPGADIIIGTAKRHIRAGESFTVGPGCDVERPAGSPWTAHLRMEAKRG